jgi:hypothetical protein
MLLRGAFQRGASSEGDHNGGQESEVWRKKPGPSDPGADVESLPAGRTGSSCPAGYNGFWNRVSRGIRPGGGWAVAGGRGGRRGGGARAWPGGPWPGAGPWLGPGRGRGRGPVQARERASQSADPPRTVCPKRACRPIGPPSQHPGSQQVRISGSWPSGWPFGTVLSPRKHRSPRTDRAARLELALGPPVQSGKHGSPGHARSSGSVAARARRPPSFRPTPVHRPPPPPATARHRPAAARQPHHHLAPVTPYLSQCAPRIRGGERGVMGAPRSRQHPPRGSAGS